MNTITNYTIKSELGQGGMATVYLAEHKTLGLPVAVKVLAKEFAHNENIRKRFLAEARNMFKMSHPNIIKVSDLIDEGDTVAFVMEYIEGDTLKDYLERKGKLNDDEIKAIFTQILAAVGYVHEQGLIHRDIKPSNFMINPKGQVKLLDFGIAKNTDTNSAEYTQTNTSQQMGTPMYMSPEQVNETKSVTRQSDIYSLGVVLWQMVMGQKPYDTRTLSNFELQLKIVQVPLALTQTIWDNCIQKATHKNLESRYTTSHLFLNELQNPESIKEDKTIFEKNDDKTIFEKTDDKTIFENKEEATTIENRKAQTITPKEEKAQPTSNSTKANVEKERKKPIGVIIAVIAGVVLLIVILIAKTGPSKEELAAKQKQMEDSIAAVNQVQADSLAKVAEDEAAAYADTLAAVEAYKQNKIKRDNTDAVDAPLYRKGDGVIEEKVVEPFLIVEEMPEFPGGPGEMLKYFAKNTHYPQMAREAGIGGKCFLGFVVSPAGDIPDVKVSKGVPGCEECDDEAVRVIKLMPNWKPGKQTGRAVPVRVTVPFNFSLK